MSPGLRVLQAARAAGITVELDGEFLSLQADGVPDGELLELLRQRKGEIVELLRLQLFDTDTTQLAGTTAVTAALCGLPLCVCCGEPIEEPLEVWWGSDRVHRGCGEAAFQAEKARSAYLPRPQDTENQSEGPVPRPRGHRDAEAAVAESARLDVLIDPAKCAGCGEVIRPGERVYEYYNPGRSEVIIARAHSERLECLISWNERWHAAAGHEYDAAAYCRHLDEAGWRAYLRLRRRWRLSSAGDR